MKENCQSRFAARAFILGWALSIGTLGALAQDGSNLGMFSGARIHLNMTGQSRDVFITKDGEVRGFGSPSLQSSSRHSLFVGRTVRHVDSHKDWVCEEKATTNVAGEVLNIRVYQECQIKDLSNPVRPFRWEGPIHWKSDMTYAVTAKAGGCSVREFGNVVHQQQVIDPAFYDSRLKCTFVAGANPGGDVWLVDSNLSCVRYSIIADGGRQSIRVISDCPHAVSARAIDQMGEKRSAPMMKGNGEKALLVGCYRCTMKWLGAFKIPR